MNRPTARELFENADTLREQRREKPNLVTDQQLADATARRQQQLDWERRGTEVPSPNDTYQLVPQMHLAIVKRGPFLALDNVPGDPTTLSTSGFKEGDVVTIFLTLRKSS